jgi:hypothetical protein
MRRWATVRDVDINWILKENLKKDRLTKKHVAEVESVLRLINGGVQKPVVF